MDTLLEAGAMTIPELTSATGYSKTLVRNNVELLAAQRNVSVDKKRQPFLYEVSPDAPEFRQRKNIDSAKAQLMGRVEQTDPIIRFFVQSNPDKEQWAEWAQVFQAIGMAIEELDEENKLINTL